MPAQSMIEEQWLRWYMDTHDADEHEARAQLAVYKTYLTELNVREVHPVGSLPALIGDPELQDRSVNQSKG